MMANYKPKALVILALRTIFQLESSNNAIDMSSVTAPVIAVTLSPPFNSTTYYRFLNVIQRFPSGVNVTLNSLEPNVWWAFRFTGWPVRLEYRDQIVCACPDPCLALVGILHRRPSSMGCHQY